MAAGIDPLSLAYNALWDMLEAHAPLTDLVTVGNRIKYDKIFHSTIKDVLTQSDLPELSIVPTGSSYGMKQTSNGTRLVEFYEVRLVSDEQRVAQQGGFLPVKWEVLRAFIGWEVKLSTLTWVGSPGNKFVKRTSMNEISDDLLNEQLTISRGFIGWVSLLRFEVEMWFRTIDLHPS